MPHHTPLFADAVRQRAGMRDLRGIVAGKRRHIGHQLRQLEIEFGRLHYRIARIGFKDQLGLRVRLERNKAWRRLLAQRLRQFPEIGRAECVEGQMHAPHGCFVHHLMHAPIVEGPRFARRHVHALALAVKADRRIGDDGDVHAAMRAPIILHVEMFRHAEARLQPHEAGAAEQRAELAQNLPDIGRGFQMLRRHHRRFEAVVVHIGIEGDQRQRRIAREILRVVAPGLFGNGEKLRLQPLHVEAEGEFVETVRQMHGAPDSRGKSARWKARRRIA